MCSLSLSNLSINQSLKINNQRRRQSTSQYLSTHLSPGQQLLPLDHYSGLHLDADTVLAVPRSCEALCSQRSSPSQRVKKQTMACQCLAQSPPVLSTSLGIKIGCFCHLQTPSPTLYILPSVLARWTPTAFFKCHLLPEPFLTGKTADLLQHFPSPCLLYFALKDLSPSEKLHILLIC